MIVDKRSQCPFRDFFDSLADLPAAMLDEMPDQGLNVLATFPQWWQQKWKHI
jgi:hypothetical protein